MIFLLGLVAAGFVLYGSINSYIFVNLHSAMIVMGGTAVVTLLVTPRSAFAGIVGLVKEVLRDRKPYDAKELRSILKTPNASVRDSYGLVDQARDLWELGANPEEFENTLRDQAETILQKNQASIAVLRSLGKYPPALGMIGTVMGMIQLFEGLGGGTEQSQVGMQLALAMTATFYGLLLANWLIIPLADRLEANEEIKRGDLELLIKTLVAVRSERPQSISEKVIYAA